jgi:hypothetical protein
MWRISRLTCYAKRLNCTRVICKALSTSAPNLFVNKRTRCHSTSVSKEEIQSFQENGAVCLRGKFSLEWLEKIKRGIPNVFANPGPFSEKLAHQDDPKCIYFNDLGNYHKVNEFSDFVFHSPASELARQLMESEVILHELYLFKQRVSCFCDPDNSRRLQTTPDGRAYTASTWCNIFITIQSITHYTIDGMTKEYNRFYENITSTACYGGFPNSRRLASSKSGFDCWKPKYQSSWLQKHETGCNAEW